MTWITSQIKFPFSLSQANTKPKSTEPTDCVTFSSEIKRLRNCIASSGKESINTANPLEQGKKSILSHHSSFPVDWTKSNGIHVQVWNNCCPTFSKTPRNDISIRKYAFLYPHFTNSNIYIFYCPFTEKWEYSTCISYLISSVTVTTMLCSLIKCCTLRGQAEVLPAIYSVLHLGRLQMRKQLDLIFFFFWIYIISYWFLSRGDF